MLRCFCSLGGGVGFFGDLIVDEDQVLFFFLVGFLILILGMINLGFGLWCCFFEECFIDCGIDG